MKRINTLVNRLARRSFRVLVLVFLLGNLVERPIFAAALDNANMGTNPLLLADSNANDKIDALVKDLSATQSNITSIDPSRVQFSLLTGGLTQPTIIANAGDGSNRIFIGERGGIIRIFSSGSLNATPFLDMHTIVNSASSEQGLLALAFHPQFETNGFFYTVHTNASGSLVLSRFSVSSNNVNQADFNSRIEMLVIPHPTYANHNGGTLTFGADGYLYWSTGDGGGAGDPFNNSQNLNSLLGKILRIDVNSGSPYAIPSTNPFFNNPSQTVRKEIWAYGLRNPWRISFDRFTHDLYIADVGQSNREEVDYQPANSTGGENYGWNVMEGSTCYGSPNGCNTSGKVFPVAEYDHSLGCSITGGYVYRGSSFPSLYGYYLYGDYCSGRLFSIYNNLPSAWGSAIQLADTSYSISTFGEDENGELYLADLATGNIYRIIYQEPPRIISGNTGVAGAVLSYTDGTPKSVTSQADGSYALSVSLNWSGLVTPSHACYTFNPVNRSYSNVTTNQDSQNYIPAYNGAVACAMAAGIYDDTHSAWVYSGAWARYSGNGPIANGLHYTFTTGDFALFPFSGTQFILTYTQDTNRGNYDVFVDGNRVTTIQAGGAFQWQKKYISPLYANGIHVVEFRNRGGGGGVMDVDAIQILATAAPGVGTYDDANPNWSYAGSWATLTTSGPNANTLHYTFTTGDAASFLFNGTRFILSYTQDTNRANYDVYVDGSRIVTIHANGTFEWQKTYTSPVFASGTHVVEFRNAGGGGGVMDVDAIQILATATPGTYDDSDAIWNYSGSWLLYSNTGPYTSTLHYTFTTGDSAWFAFSGTQFILSYTQDSNRANYDVYVDSRQVGRIHANGTFQWQKSYTSPVFASGTHVVEFRNAGGGGGVMDVDAIQILATAAPGTGTYDDTNSNWMFDGNWATYSSSGPYNNTLHYTFIAGDSASFPFTGTQIVLTYTQDTNRGSYDVLVDGNRVGNIAATGAFQWQKTYTSPVFSSGTHVVEFRNLGGGGGVMDVDAVTIN